MFALPPRQPRRRIAVGSSARLSRLHLSGSQLGLNALGCDASDGVICGRAGLQRRLAGRGRKLSLPVLSQTEAAAIEITGGLGGLAGGLADFAGQPMQQEEPLTPGSAMLRCHAAPSLAAGCASEPASRRSPPPADDEDEVCDLPRTAPAEETALTRRQAEAEAGGVSSSSSSSDTDWQQWCPGGGGATAAPPQPELTPTPTGDVIGGVSADCDVTHDVGDVGDAAAAPPSVSKKVFAANLPFNASRARLRELFEQFGTVTSVQIVKNPINGKSRGFGFVTFKEASSADNCLAADPSPRLFLLKRQIRVSPAKPRRSGVPRSRHRATDAAESADTCHVDRLPNELLHQIFSYLPVSEQLQLQNVSRRWQQAVRALMARRQRLDLDECVSAWPGHKLNDARLRRLLKLMPALRHLRTGGHARFCTWKALDIVASHCHHLVDIDLDGFCINEKSLEKLCVACPDLETVQLPHQYHFSESSVLVLVRHLARLRVLDLNRSVRVTGVSLSELPPTLERLVLAGCTGLQSDSLRRLARCPQLAELDVSAVTTLRSADLAVALVACPLLHRLAVRRLPISPESFLPESGAPQLRHLDASFSDGVSDTTLRHLPELVPALHTLNVQGCSSLTEEGLLHVRRLKELRSLDLGYVPAVSDEVLGRLCCHHLSQLHLPEGYSGAAAFTLQGVTRTVLDCRSLTLLDLSGVQTVTDALLDSLTAQLTPERDVTLYVGGTEAQSLCDSVTGVWGTAPLRAQDINTVPLHMRGYPDDDYGSSDDYDSDGLDFNDMVDAYEDGVFGMIPDDDDFVYDAGYDDGLSDEIDMVLVNGEHVPYWN